MKKPSFPALALSGSLAALLLAFAYLRPDEGASPPVNGGAPESRVVQGELEGVDTTTRDEATGIFTRVRAERMRMGEGRAVLFFRSALKKELWLRAPAVRLFREREGPAFEARARFGLYDPVTGGVRLDSEVEGEADGVRFHCSELTLGPGGALAVRGAFLVWPGDGRVYEGKEMRAEALGAAALLKEMTADGRLREAVGPAHATPATPVPMDPAQP